MNMNKYKYWLASLVLGSVLLAGCGTTAGGSHGRGLTTPGNSLTTATERNATTPGNATTVTGLGSGNQTPQTGTTDTKKLIDESKQLADQGKVLHVPYAVGTGMIDKVITDWGKPNQQNQAGAGIYATYTAQKVAFGFNKGSQIFDVRSYAPQLQQITVSQVKQVLGAAGATRHFNGQTVLLYTAGQQNQLLWVFPDATSANPDPHLDHISVFCPQDTVNLMAQDVTSPVLSVVDKPGSLGSLFTFDIQQSPTGYALSELEWIGSNGVSTVSTREQAVQHGILGGVVPSFEISGDGKTLGFLYSSSMQGQSGHVVVIYQDASGQAVIGQSGQITLE